MSEMLKGAVAKRVSGDNPSPVQRRLGRRRGRSSRCRASLTRSCGARRPAMAKIVGKPKAEDVKRVAVAALMAALDDGKDQARKKPGLTGVRAVATGAVLYTAGKAALTGRRFISERLRGEDDVPRRTTRATTRTRKRRRTTLEDEPEAEEDEELRGRGRGARRGARRRGGRGLRGGRGARRGARRRGGRGPRTTRTRSPSPRRTRTSRTKRSPRSREDEEEPEAERGRRGARGRGGRGLRGGRRGRRGAQRRVRAARPPGRGRGRRHRRGRPPAASEP